ncbi:LADA_0D13212g1_1 [Lachancea dasiensis]|uniref:LADA_0D13212g1_1 n=1 Tax=Lachancea dasiensis TaxID=1072105 RepID=A0A1G4J901_9SACH|nr:LADA_0D13212g1_1 [Lachancea dasiensis]
MTIETPYKILEKPSTAPRKIKVLVIGAGASGLNFAHELYNNVPDAELAIYEKNPSIGGTWYENRYPGCACDIPSINYQYTWAPSTDWSSYYSTGPEILQYFKSVTKQHKLDRDVHLNHKIIFAKWNEAEKMWYVRAEVNGDPKNIVEDCGEILINATGILNKWKWPNIKGLDNFKGPRLHSANWDTSLSLKGKSVGVIGSGSSAVQIVPNILDDVESITQFVRSRFWITAGFAQKFAGKNGANFEYSEEQRELLKSNPEKYLRYRKNIESDLNARFRSVIKGSPEQLAATDFAKNEMAQKLAKKPEVAEKVIPEDFGVGCRRPTPGNGFLEALCDPKTTLVYNNIEEVTENGLRTVDGIEHKFDVLICATGFDVSWIPHFPLIGRNGQDLREVWKQKPETYLSIAVPDFPNYLIFMGPHAPYAHGSVLPMVEAIAKYFVKVVKKLSCESVTSFEPKQDAVNDFIIHRRKFLDRTVWNDPCRSWFKQGTYDGELMMWPGSRIHFFETMGTPRWEDYNLTFSQGNRFEYFGNGFHLRETDGRDLSWYLGTLNDSDIQPQYTDDDIKEFLMTG